MNGKKAIFTNHKATANTPQIVTLVVDDSNSMREPAESGGGKSKAQVASESIEDMIISAQSQNLGTKGFRFLFNIAKFGDEVTPLVEAGNPEDVDLQTLKFYGNSGWTNMAVALEWGIHAMENALAKCRSLPVFEEAMTPPPIFLFLSDGANTGPAIEECAERLRSIPFRGGSVSVIACGIGMKAEHFPVMTAIASNQELALNIRPSQLAEFLAAVAATIQKRDVDHLTKFRDEWDGQMALARDALGAGNLNDAEQAFQAAWNSVRGAGDHRETLTLSCLGTLYTVQGDAEKAAPFATKALDLLQQLGPSSAEQDALEAGIRVAELFTISEKQPDADNLWKRIWGVLGTKAANLPMPAGASTVEGFRYKAEGQSSKSKQAFGQAVQAGGVGSMAALKGMAELSRRLEGRESAEPFLERLAAELVRLFGKSHPLSKKIIADLKSSYILSGKREKIKQLEQEYGV